ncbi:TM2 domain-containing protein [bacterium]|nr:TM2 domain-containing protein [bacterium]MBU1882647.1 TM2 domain-containing protein [bacterium]
MKGKVLDFNLQSGEGIISGSDGQRYSFTNAEWKSSDIHPTKDVEVDFAGADGVATGIYAEAKAVVVSTGEKSKVVAGILALFLGAFGVHKFYLGCTTAGVIMLAVWFLGLILVGIPSLIIGLIAFIEALIYFFKSDADFDRIYVKNKKCWF